MPMLAPQLKLLERYGKSAPNALCTQLQIHCAFTGQLHGFFVSITGML